MARVNIFTMMRAIITETGSKVEWKDKDSCMILMEIYNMKVSGRTITIMVKVLYMEGESIGKNTTDSLFMEKCKDSGK